MDNAEKMFVEERRDTILDLLTKNTRVSVSELSTMFNTTEVTIRRDLGELEARGLIRRTHGGAILADRGNYEATLTERENINKSDKERIARYFANVVRGGETLMIDAGSTTLAIARTLRTKSDLVVVTNSIDIAQEILGSDDNQAILTGGDLRRKTHVLVGPIAQDTIRRFRADKVILGMSALSPEEGLFTANYLEAEIKRSMMQCGKEVIVAVDSTKIDKVTFSFVSDFTRVDKVVTTSGITDRSKHLLEQHGVEVIVV